ncbi:hypothetical protein GASC598B02_004710, partial [Gilliamella apicola SCGC AB-598-B02]
MTVVISKFNHKLRISKLTPREIVSELNQHIIGQD